MKKRLEKLWCRCKDEIALFKNISNLERKKIAHLFYKRSFLSEEIIFKEGSLSNVLYLLMSGEAVATHLKKDSSEGQVISTFSPSDESKVQRLVHFRKFNHRLKNAYMTAAKSIVLHNPDLYIAGYFRNLRKKGLSIIEARKRVARALIRDFYKLLKAINPAEVLNIIDIREPLFIAKI